MAKEKSQSSQSQKKKKEQSQSLSQKLKRDPREISSWLGDILSGKAKVADIPQVMKDLLHVTVGRAGKSLADFSAADTAVAKAIVDIEKTNPTLHSALLLSVPAYTPLLGVAKAKMFATKLSSSRGEMVTPEEVLQVAGTTVANALFPNNPALRTIAQPSVTPVIADMGRHGTEQATHLAKDFENWAEYAQQVLKSVREIHTQLEKFLSFLDKDIWPAVMLMRDLVVNPYLDAIKDSKASMDELIKYYEDTGQSVDSAVPPIVGPNFDFQQYQRIALGLSMPVMGSIYAGKINALLQQKYQAQHKRGFADDLSMLQAAMGAPGPSPIAPLQQLGAGRPPAWFLAK